MKVQGEYLFKSFEEAFAFVKYPTNYEKEKGISILYSEVELNQPDFKIVKLFKTDDSITIILFFKNSTKYDIWKFWLPSKQQFELLKVALDFYALVDFHNLNLKNVKRGEKCE